MPQALLVPSDELIFILGGDETLSKVSFIDDEVSPHMLKVIIVPFHLVNRASYVATDRLHGPITHIPKHM